MDLAGLTCCGATTRAVCACRPSGCARDRRGAQLYEHLIPYESKLWCNATRSICDARRAMIAGGPLSVDRQPFPGGCAAAQSSSSYQHHAG
jgi:hypothetical protein